MWQSECGQHACRGACLGDVRRAGRRHVCVRAAACGGTLHLLLAWLQQHLALRRARCCLLPVCSGTATLLGYRLFSSHLLNLFPSVCLLCCPCPVVCSHNHRYALASSHPTLPVDSAAVHLSVPPPLPPPTFTHTHPLDLHLWYIQLPLET